MDCAVEHLSWLERHWFEGCEGNSEEDVDGELLMLGKRAKRLERRAMAHRVKGLDD